MNPPDRFLAGLACSADSLAQSVAQRPTEDLPGKIAEHRRSEEASLAGRSPRAGRGICFRLLSVTCTALLAVVVKLATQRGASSPEILFFRYAFALPLVLGWLAIRGELASIRTSRLRDHFLRAVLGMLAMLAVFMTLAALPLADTTAILFMAPLIATILSVVLLKETVGFHQWLATALGITGMLVLIRPGSPNGLNAAGIALGLCAASLTALSTVSIRKLGETQSSGTMIFWFTAFGLLFSALFVPTYARSHDAITWLLLATTGLVGTAGQTFVTAALRNASVGMLAPFEYSQIILSVVFGWWIWGDKLSWATSAGALLIIAAGLYTIHRQRWSRKHVAADAVVL